MKKKEFLSKLKFQKTTIVSFNTLKNINGGIFQGPTTQVMSVDGYTCLTLIGCIPLPTQSDDCTSIDPTVCTRPTNTNPNHTVFCVGNLPTGRECTKTLKSC